jgi:hypothetical protein
MDSYAQNAIHGFEHYKPTEDFSVRELTFYARYELEIDHDPAKAEAAIRRAFAVQEMNPSAKNYGTFPWEIQGLNHADPNSVEFTLQSLGPILLRYGDKLSPQFKQDALEHICAGLTAVRRDKVAVTYTNIYLMKIENLLLLGEWAHDSEAVKQAGDMLEQWLNLCRSTGIHEYASPTYSAVQINCLCSAYQDTRHAELKPRLKMGLDLLYASLLASYFPGQQALGGAHSRTYDCLYDGGGVNQNYFLLGLRTATPGHEIFADSLGAYLNNVEGGYAPSADLLALASEPQRTVIEAWGDQPGQDRYTFITPEFCAGSSSAWSGAQDQQIAVQLAQTSAELAAAPLATISVVADSMDAPYGKVLQKDRSGHNKPTHLRDNIAVVQHEGAMLALFDLSPGLTADPVRSVATDILLPLRAQQIVLDGRPTKNSAELEAKLNNVVGIRHGNAGVAVRIFAADGLAGQQPTFAFKSDGAQWGVGRLVAYHYRGEARSFEHSGPVRAGVLIVAGRCETDAEFTTLMERASSAKIESADQNGGDSWAVTATVAGHTLQSELNFKTGRPASRRVDGQDFRPGVFAVNGRDLAAEILGHDIASSAATAK